MNFRELVQVHRDWKRWVNLPYVLLLAVCLLLGFGDDATPDSLLPYFILLPLFLIQLLWPTVAGGAATIGGGFVLFFVSMLVARLDSGITEFNNWVLVLLGLFPLIPLFIFRPRLPRHSC